MKTIFDIKPTDRELKDLFGYDKASGLMSTGLSFAPFHLDDYVERTDDTDRTFDLALLLEYRGETDEARKYWDKIPTIEAEYRAGFDNEAIPR